MTKVYWNTFDKVLGVYGEKSDLSMIKMAYLEPEPVIPYIINNRECENNGHYTKCPAFLDYYKNTYVLYSPVDLTIEYNSQTKIINTKPQGQDFFDKFVVYRGHEIGENDPFLMSLNFYHIFVADKDCMIEQLPNTFHNDCVSSKIKIISGTFDISKWHRPIVFAFEINDTSKPLVIKRGDPLCYIRFIPKDGKKINLIEKEFSEKELTNINRCLHLKLAVPKMPLKILYDMAKKFVKPKKKCPFNFIK